jgi:DNA-binding NarL/FixJ family response regulator
LKSGVFPGAGVARQLHALDSSPAVLAYSTYDAAECIHAASAAGVAGYVLKTTSLLSLTDAVQAVAQGKPWYSPRVLDASPGGSGRCCGLWGPGIDQWGDR